MFYHNVIIAGAGFQTVVCVTHLADVTRLVRTLLELRKEKSEDPFPLQEADEHLIGFVIPALICSVSVQAVQTPELTAFDKKQIELTQSQIELTQAQIEFYRRQ